VFRSRRGFHCDPQLPWAREILSRTFPVRDESERAQRLFQSATDYLDCVSGPDNEFIDQAQTRLLTEPPDMFAGSAQSFIDQSFRRLSRIWPEKFHRMHDESRMDLLREGVRKARAFGIASESGSFLCIVMMYMLGSAFDEDPLFAWARKIAGADLEAADKIAALHHAGLEYLNNWCAGEQSGV
jgi:hypothetical protein